LAISGGSFGVIDELELEKLTHLNLAFGNPDKDGKVVFSGNADIRPFVEKGHAAGLKVFISFGRRWQIRYHHMEICIATGKYAKFC
jgi:hypothetical protein